MLEVALCAANQSQIVDEARIGWADGHCKLLRRARLAMETRVLGNLQKEIPVLHDLELRVEATASFNQRTREERGRQVDEVAFVQLNERVRLTPALRSSVAKARLRERVDREDIGR